MLVVIFSFFLLYGLRWFLEGIIQENHLEIIIGFVVLVIVFAVYVKLWLKWRKWRKG